MPRRLCCAIIAVFLSRFLVSSSALAAGQEFDFKDPKGVNSVLFLLDSVVEPIMGVASGTDGKVTFDPSDPKATTGKITVDATKIHISNNGMQDTVHGSDWLDVKKNPRVEFNFKKVTDAKKLDDNAYELIVVGDMTVKGVTKELTTTVMATYLPGKLGERQREGKGDLLVLRSNFTIKRKDFKIKPDMDNKVVAEDIEVRVSIVGSFKKPS